jgi:adenosylmethionine-8-amino-7-oxononanoate aminotransferase
MLFGTTEQHYTLAMTRWRQGASIRFIEGAPAAPDADRRSAAIVLAQPGDAAMTHLLHRAANVTPPIAVGGEGIEIVDAAGRRYIDASGGAAVSCLGHNHAEVIAALHRQLDRLAYAHTSFFTTEVAERLGDRLIEDAPAGLTHVYLVSGGSEAIEAALKMARQYFVEKGEPQRRHLIARRQSYHGNTLGALAAGGNAWRRAQFRPLLIETHHIDPCFAYRYQEKGESDEAYAGRAAQALEDKILELGPEQVIGFVAETVVGATAGAVPPVGDYFKRIRAICDKYGVLLILDEVMCGMGRTGTLHACEQEAISPDLMTVAKGLGGGYQPIGAVMVSGAIFEAIAQGSGFFQHGHTYMGHPMAAAAALAVQEVIRRDRLLLNVVAQGERLRRRLGERFANHAHVGDIRGRGLFHAVELVAERGSKEPFDPTIKLHARIKREAMARGLMVYPMGGTIDGQRGDHVLLAPPFIVGEAQIDTIVERLGEAVDAAIE